MRFPRMGLEWVQNGSNIDLRIDPPDRSRDGSQMSLRSPISQTSDINGPNKALFHVLLTIADRKEGRSKDWIRPPSQSQEYRNGC